MKKRVKYLLILLIISSIGFSVHKFYTAIYKIEFVSQKKRIEITTRIFIDDLNEDISKKYNHKVFIASDKETSEDIVLLKKYLSEKFILTVNGQIKPMNFINKEVEENILICYLTINNIPNIKTLEVENSILTEVHPEQQNIIQANFNGEKHSLLLTSETYKGMLK